MRIVDPRRDQQPGDLLAAGDPQPVQHRGNVQFSGALADAEQQGHASVADALRQQFRHLALPPLPQVVLAFGVGAITTPLGKVSVKAMPDSQTQAAELMVGGLDVGRTQTKDEADAMAANPELGIITIPDQILHTLMIDAVGRSGNVALTKLEVRQAIAMAVDVGAATMDPTRWEERYADARARWIRTWSTQYRTAGNAAQTQAAQQTFYWAENPI
jgi:hypothetical protein